MNRFILSAMIVASAWAIRTSPALAQDSQLNWAEKMFSVRNIDFGTVARGADARQEIVITNLYEEDVTIANVDTTCGCTAAKPDKTLLKTHEQARISVQMNTVKFTHRKDSNVDVTLMFHGANGSATRKVRVPVTAYIRTDVVLTPGNADFGSVEYGTGAVQRIQVAYAGRDNWHIKDVRVGDKDLEAEVREISRGAGRVNYELVIKLSPEAAMGNIQDQVTLITDDSNTPEVPVVVMGRVEPDIVLIPAVKALHTIHPGEEVQFPVVLRGKRPFVIEKIECGSDRNCLEFVQSAKEAKPNHVVPFKLTVPNEPGHFSEEITFNIAGRDEPLVFRAEGVISGEHTASK